MKDKSTLLTSPLSLADFIARLAFFAIAPFAIVLAAELFPVRGALIDVGLALSVFILGETPRRFATRFRPLGFVLKEALAFETYYRARQPRRFAYYLAYPLLFPYWLINREAREEFLMFRGYTLPSFLVLLGGLVWQYFRDWPPELGFTDFLPAVFISLGVETLLVLSLLMPIATTVVWYHSSFRRRRLLAMLLVGVLSTSFALTRVLSHRDPIVSYLTKQRVRLRTAAARKTAHRALFSAVEVAWRDLVKVRGVDGDGKVEGKALDDARLTLETFYKHDETFAFDLWASPRSRPRVLVLYAQSRRKQPSIWVALKDGAELRKPDELPRGAFAAMRSAEDTTDPVGMVWDDDSTPEGAPSGSSALGPPSGSAAPSKPSSSSAPTKPTKPTSSSAPTKPHRVPSKH
ncbi:MAG TPA: hypothetical protein VNW92_30550 [Polyangiaceae bacterium]|nr:hypothetical protein [Polyangiaceae bacterium]